MAIPVQRLPRDFGPTFPKSRGTPIVGSRRDMCDPTRLENKRLDPLSHGPRGRPEVLDAADTERSSNLGSVCVRTPAISPRRRSPPPCVYHDVGHGKPGSESTNASASPILAPFDRSQNGSNKPSGITDKRVRHLRQRKTPESSTSKMMRQPETKSISQDPLVAEVKGIYAALIMEETECIEVGNAQSSESHTSVNGGLNSEQWQALIALHRTLLHEHHDFFLASQNPTANPALRRLASKYAMPARMCRHGIHSFLELLRHRLPTSLEHMLTFLYLAYSIMALLYETVPAFEDTWIECLGDLGRYRMAIEDDDIRDREVWTGVSRHWFSKASDKSPVKGRLYHHLAILARPNALQQFPYYTKALADPIPFTSARESITTLFDPTLSAAPPPHWSKIDTAFVHCHSCLLSSYNGGDLDDETFKQASGLHFQTWKPIESTQKRPWPSSPCIATIEALIRDAGSILSFPISENLGRVIGPDIIWWKHRDKRRNQSIAMIDIVSATSVFSPSLRLGSFLTHRLSLSPLANWPLHPHFTSCLSSAQELFWPHRSYENWLIPRSWHYISDYITRLETIELGMARHLFDVFTQDHTLHFGNNGMIWGVSL